MNPWTPSPDALLLVMALVPWVGAVVAGLMPRHARNVAAAVAWLFALSGFGAAVLLYPMIASGVLRHEVEWLPSLGVGLVLRLDGLSWLFSVLVLGIGALVVVYARYYMSKKDPVPRFFAYLLAFMGAMQGVVMSGNLVQMVVFWELTSLFSFLLIGYWYNNPAARDGARMALTVTATGGLCLLVGVLLLGHVAGSLDLDAVLASGEAIQASPLYLPALLLILAGAFTKSAQFPFHFWLPRAMTAPTPVSAYLHSATMVKAGIFLMMRLWPVLAGTDAWYLLVGTAGILTLLVGAYSAIFQHDLKGLLAYSTISHLGLITLLLGLGTPLGFVAALFHTLNHATFKASLFMAAGIIDHETGTRDLRRLSGLWRFMPITATLAMVAAAAMAGVPLLNGFLSKEMFLAEAVEAGAGVVSGPYDRNLALPVLATLASAFSVLYSLRFIHQTFFGPAPQGLPREPHEPPRWMRFPIELLVLLCVVVGVLPSLTIGPFLETGVRSVLGDATPYYSLAVFHGLNLPLLMSVVALVGGVALYVAFRHRVNTNPRGGPWLFRRFDGGRLFERFMAGAFDASEWVERTLGTRRLQGQLRSVVLVVLGGTGLAAGAVAVPWGLSSAVDPAFALLWLVGGGCAVATAWLAKYHRLAATATLGGAGLVSCATFVWLSAPDLAATQLLVEVVTTVLLLLGLRWLPKRVGAIPASVGARARARRRRALDLVLASAFGLGLGAIAFRVMTLPPGEGISSFFLRYAYEEGGGRNVVNVLLVDFRAFDTLGEISVLGLVALTVFALLLRFRPAADSLGAPAQQQAQDASDHRSEDRSVGDTLQDTMLVPGVIMQWLFPVIILFAAHLFLRGHNQPGGGFAAGVAMSIAFILQYMASGTRWVEDRLRIRPLRWMGFGLAAATLTGMGSWVFGAPFLTSWFAYVEVPVLGEVPLPTAVVFDLGVFALVVGSTVLMLIALAHQSLRKPRERAPAHPPAAPLHQVA